MKQIYFSKLKNDEFLDLSKSALDVTNGYDASALGMEVLVNAMGAANQTMDAALHKNSGFLVTPDLDKLFVQRYKAYVGLHRAVLSQLAFADEATDRSVERILFVLRTHTRGITQQTLVVANSRYSTLLRDLTAAGETADAIAALQVGKWVERLQAVHTEYEAKRRERVEEEANKTQVTSAEGRTAVQKAFTELYTYVNLMAKITSVTEYADMDLRLETIANYLMARVNARLAGDAETETEESQAEQPVLNGSS